MEAAMTQYDVAPLAVRAGEEAVIRIRPRFAHAAFPAEGEFRVRVAPMLGALPDGTHRDYHWGRDGEVMELLSWQLVDGVLEVRARFSGEQRHTIWLEKTDGTPIREFSVYSLEPDLYARRPFKGDFHIHTTGSDGRECPEYVAARYRSEGFDFVAITDHRQYEPSQRAADFWKPYPTGLKVFHGEEVHPPDCPVHMVNFGGDFSVNEMFRQEEERYRSEVKARIARLGAVTPGVDPFAVAATGWTFDKIREGGGLAVYCHPYWDVRGMGAISGALADEVFRRREFDAYEIIGGYWKHQSDSNLYQIVRAYEEWARGNTFPLVGLSDSHGTERGGLFGWYYTLVFAESDRLEDLTGAIRAGYCVPVDAPAGERMHCHGSSRLVRYGMFLLEEYFPRHRELCRPEGEVMLELLGGEPGLTETLAKLSPRPAAFRTQSFPR